MSDSKSQKGYHRDTKGDDYSDRQNKDTKVPAELKNLIRKDVNDYQVMQQLRKQYPNDDELVGKIFDQYKNRLDYIRKKAAKFKTMIFSHPKYSNLPLPQILEKGKKLKDKYGFSDDEFHLFVNMAVSDKAFAGTNVYNVPNTPMSRTLGYSIDISGDRLKVKENELDILQDILRLYAETKALHSQIVIQHSTYVDCSPEALTGSYNRDKHNAYSYVHPVIAALFLPKIKYIDEHMLVANIANIIKSKYENKPIMTQPEFELYWDIITDPNEVSCIVNRESPLADLKSRIVVQTRLWESVLNLRQGKYYNEKLTDFLISLDNCNGNIFDAPDLTYVKDEGTILRRILGAFSLRPTIVSTTPLYGIMSGHYSMSPTALTQITSIPMVVYRLPLNNQHKRISVHLNESLEQPQWFVENKLIVPKNQTIVYSRDILIFYANRRYQTINFGRLTSPCNFTALPTTVTGFESINDVCVNFTNEIDVGGDTFLLRSVVMVEKSQMNKNLIIGSTAAIVIPRNIANGKYDESYLLYDPQGAGEQFESDGSYVRNNPITYIPGESSYNDQGGIESFYKRACCRGTVYVYVKDLSNRPCL